MLTIFITVLPVFLLISAGYLVVLCRYMPVTAAETLNAFAIKLAVPVLLFNAMVNLDFAAAFSPALLVSFYSGAFFCFTAGTIVALYIFKRRPGESVVVGFSATFSNSLLLGVAVVERFYGGDVTMLVFGILAFHSPSVYTVGIVTMELMRADGQPLLTSLKLAGKSIIRNPLMVGILSGVLVNLSGLTLPEPFMASCQFIANAALPVALVAIGMAMTRYQIREGIGESLTISFLSLIVHPLIAFTLSHWVFDLPLTMVYAATTLAAMPPGMNIYVFAAMYNRAVSTAASAFLIATMLSVLSVSSWLYLLSHWIS